VCNTHLAVTPCGFVGGWNKIFPKSSLHSDERERTIFHKLEEDAEKNIEKVLLQPAASDAPLYEKKIKQFYATCIDDFSEYKLIFCIQFLCNLKPSKYIFFLKVSLLFIYVILVFEHISVAISISVINLIY